MKTKYRYLTLVMISLTACTPIEQDEEIVPPDAVKLIFPEHNTECNTGISVSDFQSTVTFRWEPSSNTNVYEVFVSELSTNDLVQAETETNSVDITINKATAYEWYVVSKSDLSTETSISETWQFYNAGDAVANYAPFPADIVAPAVGSSLAGITSVDLQWEGNDIDNDITEYEIFFGMENPPVTTLGIEANSKAAVEVDSGNTYYWLIKTIDATGNSSESDIFWFRVV